ncbi:MAG TPA: acetyl-CoA C-acetyltransferase [Candidatus Thermoplasmatota archaeon]|nr:acetyl-CoA C-acetyltransferase [Candidatus Thermoplasmatota archaeon]
MTEVVLAGAVRTPIGKFLGGLKDVPAPELGAVVAKEALARAHVAPGDVDEVVLGEVLQAGVGQNPARQVALKAGLPPSVAAFTVNKVCGSSLKAVMLAAAAIRAGDAEVVLAGGMESMTRAPHLLRAREGVRYGDGKLVDALQHDGLVDAFYGMPMGVTGEVVAAEFGVTREEADAFAARSHKRAAAAQSSGRFKEEIVPVTVPGKKPVVVSEDEGIRPDTTVEGLSRLRAAFQEGGVVTAGNSSQMSDGASAVVVASREAARRHGMDVLGVVEAYGTVGVEPRRVMAAPIEGVKALMDRAGLRTRDLGLFEHNEAFATASVAVQRACDVPDDSFNVNGGAVALGHPLGASGARVLTTLLHEMRRRGVERGLSTLCLGGGNAVTMVVRRP